MTRKGARCLAVIALLASALTNKAIAQTRAPGTGARVVCATEFRPAALSQYGFARAMLESLWYARTAVKDAAKEIQQGQKTGDSLAFLTASMRATKLSTNDFICAKRTVERFASPKTQLLSVNADQRDKIRTAAKFALKVYDAHIDINRPGAPDERSLLVWE